MKSAEMHGDPLAKPAVKKKFNQLQSIEDELGKVGFILPGSITKRFMRCGRKGCACQTDPKAIHGPYYEWTRKVDGRTVSVRLSEKDALILSKWIENKNRLYELISKIEQIGLDAAKLIRG